MLIIQKSGFILKDVNCNICILFISPNHDIRKIDRASLPYILHLFFDIYCAYISISSLFAFCYHFVTQTSDITIQ